MRSFSFVSCCLALLLVSVSCSKSTIDSRLEGDWRLVYTTGPSVPGPMQSGIQKLGLHFNTYTIKFGDIITASGAYHIGHLGIYPQPILYLGSEEYGSQIRFNKDTLLLTYTGLTTAMYLPPVSAYVRM